MSTVNHLQKNGMTERVNRVVEDTLQACVGHRQNNWHDPLPLCEFAIYNSVQVFIGETPFYLNHGLHPITTSSLLNPTLESNRLTPGAWLENRMEALHKAKDAIVAVQARQALYADRTQTEDFFKVDYQVLVFRYLLTTEARDRPADKLRLK